MAEMHNCINGRKWWMAETERWADTSLLLETFCYGWGVTVHIATSFGLYRSHWSMQTISTRRPLISIVHWFWTSESSQNTPKLLHILFIFTSPCFCGCSLCVIPSTAKNVWCLIQSVLSKASLSSHALICCCFFYSTKNITSFIYMAAKRSASLWTDCPLGRRLHRPGSFRQVQPHLVWTW